MSTDDIDPYHFRANMSASMTLAYDMRRTDMNFALGARLFKQLKEIGPNYLGDFYPLTEYTPAMDAWMAWQYDRPETGIGMVQAFRRDGNTDTMHTYRLHGLDPIAQYLVTDVDSFTPVTISGKALLEDGLIITIPQAPGAAVITYHRLQKNLDEQLENKCAWSV